MKGQTDSGIDVEGTVVEFSFYGYLHIDRYFIMERREEEMKNRVNRWLIKYIFFFLISNKFIDIK